jgi:hypothetical protein
VNIEFDWRVGDQSDNQETLAQVKRRRKPPRPWWVWILLVGIVAAVTAGGVLYIKDRAQRAEEQIVFQIQSTIDLEARAYERQDYSLFLEQQDEREPEWFGLQSLRVGTDCFEPETVDTGLDFLCQPVLPAQVQDVDLRGDVAWVEVLEGDPALRRVRFYRQTDQGWKHTAPQEAFWGVAIELNYGGLIFRYHRRDEPYVNPMIEAAAQTFDEVCAELGCVLETLPEFDFAVHNAPGAPIQQTDNVYQLDSPWLVGLPPDETQQAPYQDQIEYAIAYDLASLSLAPLSGHEGASELVDAMADEYAVWKSEDAVDKAPILKRLVARHGKEALPEILRSLRHIRTLNVVLVQWLLLSPTDHPVDYFQTLLDIEQEALSAGRKETFLLLQDPEEPGWIEQQQARYTQIRANGDLPLPEIKVQSVEVMGDLARVTIEPLPTDEQSPSWTDQTAFFRRRGGDWKRSSSTSQVSTTRS